MTPEQHAERAERKYAARKAREEIRNAVRKTLTDGGISEADIWRAAQEIAKEIVLETLKERNLVAMVERIVEQQLLKATAAVNESLPGPKQIKDLVLGKITQEATELAKRTVQKSCRVSFNEMSHYENGGSF